MYNKVSKVINRFFTFFTKNITKIVYPFLENKGKVNRTCNWGFNPLTSRGPLSIFYSCNNPLLFCPMIQGIRLGNIRQTTNSLITQYLPGFLNFAWAMSVMGQDIPPTIDVTSWQSIIMYQFHVHCMNLNIKLSNYLFIHFSLILLSFWNHENNNVYFYISCC